MRPQHLLFPRVVSPERMVHATALHFTRANNSGSLNKMLWLCKVGERMSTTSGEPQKDQKLATLLQWVLNRYFDTLLP